MGHGIPLVGTSCLSVGRGGEAAFLLGVHDPAGAQDALIDHVLQSHRAEDVAISPGPEW